MSRKIGEDQGSGPEDRERRGFDGLRDGVAAGYSKQAGATAPEHPAATASAIPADGSAEDAEMWCDRCGQRHGVVWFAPNDLWNKVVRGGERGNPDEFGFCCPLCFMRLAEERLGPMVFKVNQEVYE